MTDTDTSKGAQRLSLQQLQAWESLGYGMFLHFGMSTFDGDELSQGNQPSTLYAPDKLDVDQWVSVARDAGMKYAVLTAKHTSGHCLWPSRYTDYHVGTSGNKTDVVGAFVEACSKRGVLPGLYYCSWDNHHKFGSSTPSEALVHQGSSTVAAAGVLYGSLPSSSYTTRAYEEFQSAQLEELLTGYGKIAEVWIDIPGVLTRDYRNRLTRQIAEWQPGAVIMMNHGVGDGSMFNVDYAWPTDLMAIERSLPNSVGHPKWREIEGQRYYLPGEVCETLGKEWFYAEDDQPRSEEELLGIYLICRKRNVNLLLDVGPDKHGLIQPRFVDALMKLRKRLDSLGM